jgi:hypothetical protein
MTAATTIATIAAVDQSEKRPIVVAMSVPLWMSLSAHTRGALQVSRKRRASPGATTLPTETPD